MMPEFAQDMILEYIPVIRRLGITERIDKPNLEKVRRAKILIRRAIYNWALDYSLEMNSNHISKTTYKRFYPMYLRKAFIKFAQDYLAGDQQRIANKIEFNEIIDELTDTELYLIGW